MKIVVCIKQVPGTSQVEIDEATGVLKRDGAAAKINPYDLYALEAALRLKERSGGTVTAVTMGPPQAEQMMREAYMMGVDEAYVFTDRVFAGADVLATSYTLAQGIRSVCREFDLIVCGKQTTDGDTAQVGPAIAEHMGIPHCAWVSEIVDVNDKAIDVRQNLVSITQVSRMHYPCLITVDKDMCVPRLPSYILKKKTDGRKVRILTFDDLPDQNLSRYGLIGSPTSVARMFAPPKADSQVYLEGSPEEKASQLFDTLTAKKVI